MNTPVVFLVFNRPDLTRRVFERIRQARPPKLLVVCDGPRVARPEDQDKVAAVQRIIAEGVDWPCEVITNYSERNLGCRERVASGITWAFSLVEEAIILEDDCLPDVSFFTFCDQMLERFRGDDRVMHINGTNFITSHLKPRTSYFFSKYVWVWGWATWRRAWQHYDYSMSTWNLRFHSLNSTFDSRRERAYWLSTFETARRDWQAAATWDFSWIYSCWAHGALTVMPSLNLVENLGFGPGATHTTRDAPHLRIPAVNLSVARHPIHVRRSRVRDDMMFRAYSGLRLDWRSDLAGTLRVLHRQLCGLGAETLTGDSQRPSVQLMSKDDLVV